MTEKVTEECLRRFNNLEQGQREIMDNHLQHLDEKININTSWTKWGIGVVITICLTILGIIVSVAIAIH